MHGRTRNKLRRGAQVVQKVGEAVVQGISLRAQKRTKHELLKHERNMEKIRIAGKLRRYINSSLKRNESTGLSPHLTVSEVVKGSDGEEKLDVKGKAVLQMVIVTDIVAHLRHKLLPPMVADLDVQDEVVVVHVGGCRDTQQGVDRRGAFVKHLKVVIFSKLDIFEHRARPGFMNDA